MCTGLGGWAKHSAWLSWFHQSPKLPKILRLARPPVFELRWVVLEHRSHDLMREENQCSPLVVGAAADSKPPRLSMYGRSQLVKRSVCRKSRVTLFGYISELPKLASTFICACDEEQIAAAAICWMVEPLSWSMAQSWTRSSTSGSPSKGRSS